jgi:beta-aspartyl-peptidase (threonine type)
MKKIAIAVHGGAGPDSVHIKQHIKQYEEGLKAAIHRGYAALQDGGSSVDAVETAVRELEDNPLFNAGRGSALDNNGKVSMDAAIMNGKDLTSGAVANLKNVKNPVTLARTIMEKSNYVLLAQESAMKLAEQYELEFEPDEYFVTTYQAEEHKKSQQNEIVKSLFTQSHGTVGAVALDYEGNLAAATSTGGSINGHPGRISDSCLIGIGCYANNDTCAVSATGDGEVIMSGVIAHAVSARIAFTRCTMAEAANRVLQERLESRKADIGLITVNTEGHFGISFTSERMHRAWMSSTEPLQIRVY